MLERFKKMFTAKPPVKFIHPEFGVLVLESGVWSGKALRDGRNIRFYVGGTPTEPDGRLLEHLRDLIVRFSQVEQAALEFLRKQEPDVSLGEFTFYSLDFLWEDKPDDFAIEFELAGDGEGIWRVEFYDGQPQFVGRDD